MEKIKLPIIKKEIPAPKQLSMDDYLKFVISGLKYNFDRKADRKLSKKWTASAAFSLK